MVLVLVATALVVAACGEADEGDDGPTDTRPPSATGPDFVLIAPTTTQAPSDLVTDNTEFAIGLFAIVAVGNENVLIAPASISEGLALPYLGARGETATEMAAALNFNLDGDELYSAIATLRDTLEGRENDQLELAVANRAFGQTGFPFRDEYLADLSRWFEAPLGMVDFADPETARAEVNEWTAEQTNQRIQELFPPGTISVNTRLALVNAVYLNADWHFPFNPELTKQRRFRLLDGSKVLVDTMNFNEWMPNGSGPGWEAIRLPYAGEEMSMMVVVPDNFERFKRNFSAKRMANIRDAIEDDAGIHLHLPKFELSHHLSLIPALQELGMGKAFGAADFSGINDGGGLRIGAIEHEVFVQVDEEGTEAAGATGTSMPLSHGPTIKVNKPFIFWIQDDATGAILFLGQVTDPRG